MAAFTWQRTLVLPAQISYSSIFYRIGWELESGQSGGGHVAAGSAQNKARGSAFGASFEGDLLVRHPGEEVFLAFRKQFKLRQGIGLCEALCEEPVAFAGDF
jgi:hypothetical protein